MGVTRAYEPSAVGLKPGPQQAAELSVCQVEDSGSQFSGAGDDCQTVSHLTELPAQCRRLRRLVPRTGSPHSLLFVFFSHFVLHIQMATVPPPHVKLFFQSIQNLRGVWGVAQWKTCLAQARSWIQPLSSAKEKKEFKIHIIQLP